MSEIVASCTSAKTYSAGGRRIDMLRLTSNTAQTEVGRCGLSGGIQKSERGEPTFLRGALHKRHYWYVKNGVLPNAPKKSFTGDTNKRNASSNLNSKPGYWEQSPMVLTSGTKVCRETTAHKVGTENASRSQTTIRNYTTDKKQGE